MAATTGSRDQQLNTTGRQSLTWRDEWTPAALTAGVIMAITVVLGAAWVGAIVAALFIAGNAAVALEGRKLRVDEFAAISSLHAAAALVLSLSL